MAIIVKTPSPNKLLADIKAAVERKEVDTWQYDADGDFTHSPEQWARKAWLRPRIENGDLIFTILPRKDTPVSKIVYGVYHGRFIEMLLNHFDTAFSQTEATALPARGDVVKSSA